MPLVLYIVTLKGRYGFPHTPHQPIHTCTATRINMHSESAASDLTSHLACIAPGPCEAHRICMRARAYLDQRWVVATQGLFLTALRYMGYGIISKLACRYMKRPPIFPTPSFSHQISSESQIPQRTLKVAVERSVIAGGPYQETLRGACGPKVLTMPMQTLMRVHEKYMQTLAHM